MGCHRLLPGFPNSCSLYSLFSTQQPGRSFKNKSDHRQVTHLQTPRCASRGPCLPFFSTRPLLCLYYSVPIPLAAFLFLRHMLIFTPRAFALLSTTPWGAISSNVCVTTFLSFRFQLKCHFYTWSLFLKSFLLCQYISLAFLCLNFFFIALITFQMISFICMFSCLWPDSLIRI